MSYSSLVQLQRLPFSAIVEIVLDLARKLGLESVAEGVETQEVLDSLIDLQCNAVQGYWISKPVAATRIVELVGAQSAKVA